MRSAGLTPFYLVLRCAATNSTLLRGVAVFEQWTQPGALLLSVLAYAAPQISGEGPNSQKRRSQANVTSVLEGRPHRQISEGLTYRMVGLLRTNRGKC
jgi:hypothetical protein